MPIFDETGTDLAFKTGADPTWVPRFLEALEPLKEDHVSPQPEPSVLPLDATIARSTGHIAPACALASQLDRDPRVPAMADRPSATVPAILPRPHEERVVSAEPSDLKTALSALERATTDDEVQVAIEGVYAAFEAECADGTPPLVVLLAVFGPEDAAKILDVCEGAVGELNVEAEATGGVLTDQAAKRIALRMAQRLTQSNGRIQQRVPDARRALFARKGRAPRAHRGHRRAARVSAKTSAGDGPPPPNERPRPASVHEGARRTRARSAGSRSHTSARSGQPCSATSDR